MLKNNIDIILYYKPLITIFAKHIYVSVCWRAHACEEVQYSFIISCKKLRMNFIYTYGLVNLE